jgi:ABC-type transporter Mla subunit MlaD
MTRRHGRSSIASQPALLGALTILMALVAVYIVYNANSGLPFVPAYNVRAVIGDAEHMGKTGDVRIGGVLVGKVGDRRLEVMPNGSTRAVLDLALQKSIEPLPQGTQIRMRAMSSLGSNYVEIIPGHSTQPLSGNPPTIMSVHAPPEISFPDALEAYDKKTRGEMGRYLGGAGDSLAGRGSDLNEVIALAPQTMSHLEGAARVLASRSADLAGFIDGFSRLSDSLAPVAQQQAGLFRGLDRTFSALAPVRANVADATSTAPPMLDAGIRGFPSQRGLVRETTALFAALRPGLHAVSGAANDIGVMSTKSPAAFRSLQGLSPRLASSARALGTFSTDPSVIPALRTLTGTFNALAPTIADLSASQTVCNYPGVALRNLMSVLSDGTGNGNFLNAGAALVLPGPNGEAGPAAAPANGPKERKDNYLHSTLTPYTGSGPQPECESGNEKFQGGQQAIGHAPGRQPAHTERTVPGRPR